jgi:hypothetical protein
MPLPVFVSETLHHEATDWARRVSANGGAISTSTIRAVSDFCAAIDRGGLRSSMYRLNLFCGGNLLGALVPLYRGPTFGGTTYGNTTDTNVNFVSADFIETGATGGLKGNGISKYLDTGLAHTVMASSFSCHVAFSGTAIETNLGGVRTLIGAFTGANSANISLWATVDANGRVFQMGVNSGDGAKFASPASSEALLIGVRRAQGDAAIYSAGVVAGSSSKDSGPQNNQLPFFIFAQNINGGPNYVSAARARVYSIGLGLTDAQAAAFTSAVSALNAALGR